MRFLSVIIPTCNRNEQLEQCLLRLQPSAQLLDAVNYEVIVSDDSEHGIAKEMIERKYSWAKWVDGPKRGPAANRNNGTKYAKGNWLVFTDDDCLPTAEWLLEYSKAIAANTHKVFEGLTDADRPKQKFNEQSPRNLKGGRLWSCNFAIEKALFVWLDGFDEKFPFAAMEDVEFHQRVKEITRVEFLPKAKTIHPWRTAKAFANYRKWLASHKYIMEKYEMDKGLPYKWTRTKILLSKFYTSTRELVKFNFKGTGFFLEQTWFNVLMIFA